MVNAILNVIRQFVKEEEGLSAAEYAIMLTLIALALVTAVTTFRTAIATAIGNATTVLNS